VGRLLTALEPYAGVIVGALVGFLSSWGLLEVGEARKRAVHRRIATTLVIAELRHIEVVLNSIICTFSVEMKDTPRFVREFRWTSNHVTTIARGGGVPPLPEHLSKAQRVEHLTDEQIAALMTVRAPSSPQRCLEIPTPIIHGVLKSAAVDFDAGKLEALATVGWHCELLRVEAQRVNDLGPMTFSVADPTNHEIVVENIARGRHSYYQRVTITLDVVRMAITALAG
jgi:hypothetical protein